LLQAGRGEEAVRQFEAAVKIDPGSPKGHLNLGLALLQINDKTGACREFEEVLRVNPTFTLPPAAEETLQSCRGDSTGRK
jgi:Flp pilus assembly protein TadD